VQRVPILPTIPWQADRAVVSDATPVVITATFKPSVLIHSQAERVSRQSGRVHRPLILYARAAARPSGNSLVHSQARSRIRRLGHQIAIVTRPAAVLGVRREKTIKGVLVHRASSVAARGHLKRHNARILRAPLVTRVPLAVTRSVTKRAVFKTKRKRHEPFMFKAPFVVTVVATAETIKHVYVRSVARLVRQRREVSRNPAIILRPPWTGVRREKTIKAIFVRSVGRQEQLAKHRRHQPSILKTPLRVSTPVGRIVLHPVDRTRDRRRRKFAFIFRSRGGTATFVTQETLKHVYTRSLVRLRSTRASLAHHQPIITRPVGVLGVRREKTLKSVFLHQVPRKWSARRRRHKALLMRAPITVTRGRQYLHPMHKAAFSEPRRHRLIFLRAKETGLTKRTTKPILVRGFRKRQVAWHRRHFARILRSLGGRAQSQVVFIEPFDQPTPTGRTSSVPSAGDYDYPGPLGRTSSSPTHGPFDSPVPIGVTDIPDPEV